MTLEQLGWSAWFADRFGEQQHDASLEPARVAGASRDHYLVWTSQDPGERHVTISGRFRYQHPDLRPVTGDWVLLRDERLIEGILPRRTRISRKDPGRGVDEQVLAANADRLFIVSGLDHDFNPRRLERYLLLASESGAEPVIVLNKADLHDDVSNFVERTRAIAGCEILAVSAREGWGLAAIPSLLRPGETGALIGSSGAGKSTIVNALLGEERQRTSAVRESDQRGRHTTTHRELLRMPGNWLLIDMPGLRELQLWADPERVDDSFAEIAELASQCRFRDCRHQGEPGCAVAAAQLDEGRLRSYEKLQRELRHLDRERDLQAALAEKKRWKSIHKAMRNIDKRR